MVKITADNVLLHYKTNPTEISVDGIPHSGHDCVAFDVEEGWAEFVFRDSSGRIVADGPNIRIERLGGAIVPNSEKLP